MMKNKNKDVLFLCQFFYPEYISSAMLPFDTAKHLKDAGYKVGVLCGYPKEYRVGDEVPERECVEGVDIHRVKYVQLDRKKVLGRIVNYFSFVIFMLFHIGEAKDYKTIILYSNPPLLPIIALLCKKLYKNKLVYVSYDVYPEIAIKTDAIGEGGLTAKFFRALNARFFKNIDRVVALSEDMQEFLQQNRSIEASKVRVIPNWYEDCLRKESKKTEVLDGIPENAFVISYLGNLGTCQDADIIVNLAKYLLPQKDIFFVVAGHGNKLESLKECVKKDALSSVLVFPFLHGADYETVLARSNMFMVTLVPGLSGLCAPSKIYAYLMSEKPVIAAMDATMEISKDIEKYSAGVVCDSRGCEILGDKIIALKNDAGALNEMGVNARKLFLDKYEKDICLHQYEELIKEVVEK